MSDKIKVFVSSIQNKQAEDLSEEREAAIRAIESIQFTEPWAFEYEPAMPLPPEEVFLEGVAISDIFILVVGEKITPAVKKEYYYAADLQKKILIFPKNGAPKSPDVATLLDEASSDCKYDSFKNAEDLEQKCARALEDIIVKAVKHPTDIKPSPHFILAQEMNKLKDGHKAIQLHPLYPQSRADDTFYIRTTNSQFIELYKESNGQTISVPLKKVDDVSHSSDKTVLELNGRLQWTDPERKWKFFVEHPKQQNHHGIPYEVDRHYPEISGLATTLRSEGTVGDWIGLSLVSSLICKGWEIFYDADGRYLTASSNKPSTKSLIFIIKRES